MFHYTKVKEVLNEVLATKAKKVKLKLNPTSPSTHDEKIYHLTSATVDESIGKITLQVTDEAGTSHIVVYEGIESLDSYDNGSSLKVWVYFSDSTKDLRFYIFYQDSQPVGVQINGAVFALEGSLDEQTFKEQFLAWVESNEWNFGGHTKQIFDERED